MSNNRKYIASLAGLIILSLAMAWWVVKPAVSSVRRNKHEIDYQKQKLSELLVEGQSVVENQKNLAVVQVGIGEIDKVWLSLGNELKFITDLENAAKQSGVEQVINFDNTKTSGATEIKTIALELEVRGELPGIMSYIYALEALDYYINISRVEINALRAGAGKQFANQIEEEQEGAQLSVHLSGTTYWK